MKQYDFNNMSDEQKKAFFYQQQAQAAQQDEAFRVQNLLANLYSTYVRKQDNVIDVSPKEVFYEKAIKLNLPEHLARKFSEDVLKKDLHINNIKGDCVLEV